MMIDTRMLRLLGQVMVLLVSSVGIATTAQAQGTGSAATAGADTSRAFIMVGGGIQSATAGFDDRRQSPMHAEQANFDIRYGRRASTAIDIGGGARIWRQLWAGVAVVSARHDHGMHAAVALPHPFRFNAARTFDAEQGGLRRSELGVHVQVLYRTRVARRVQVGVFAGPSWMKAEQDLVGRINYTDEYPYELVTFTGVSTERTSASGLTANVGGSLHVDVAGPLAIGAHVRWASTTVELTSGVGTEVRTKVGGTQALVSAVVGF